MLGSILGLLFVLFMLANTPVFAEETDASMEEGKPDVNI